MRPRLPAWPAVPPEQDGVRLRAFRDDDVDTVLDLAGDPRVAAVSTLPEGADEPAARAWIARQHRRWAEGAGFSFAVAEGATDRAVGQVGLWLDRWAEGVGTVGYLVAPCARRRGVATRALRAVTAFAATLPGLDRLELFVEPGNTASLRTAQRAGYRRVDVVPHPRRAGDEPVPMVRLARRLPGTAAPRG
ncbi:GNAT family N-acetyltransferase [Geodermatophilus sp. URMC 62]|uniref:GNAT family N-acetyltransferase n=1 Tax=Geodermatophilus sp. URMC 62 TaxID=3423414 RepID=UPI00406C1DB1